MLYRFKSNLFVPGHKMHNLEDIQRTDVNALIIDLEDGCPDDLKKEAREDLINNFKDGNKFSKPVFVRVNDPITDLGREDIDLISDYQEQIEAIILPKIQSFDSLATLATKIAFEDDLIPLIETPRAVATVDEIASFKGVRGLFFGAADFSAGLKAKLAWEPLLYARSKVAIAAAMYDLFTIDAPFFFLDDPEGCEQEPIAVKNMGFTGKACIHPSQVDIINKAFEPTKEEKEEAMKVLKEYEKIGGSGVIKVDGKMVDEPIAEAMRLRLELGEDDD